MNETDAVKIITDAERHRISVFLDGGEMRCGDDRQVSIICL